ncbi:MAG: hypothetical protein ACQERB_11275 [Promethearchaeati archaeon]
MSKLKKSEIKNKKKLKENIGYKTVIKTAILSGIFFIVSLFFNGQIISLGYFNNLILNIVEILVRTVIILFFFLFLTISYANYRDLVGKPINWKNLMLLFILSIIQSILNIYVFFLTLLGLIFILLYLYLIQE